MLDACTYLYFARCVHFLLAYAFIFFFLPLPLELFHSRAPFHIYFFLFIFLFSCWAQSKKRSGEKGKKTIHVERYKRQQHRFQLSRVDDGRGWARRRRKKIENDKTANKWRRRIESSSSSRGKKIFWIFFSMQFSGKYEFNSVCECESSVTFFSICLV